MRAQDTEREPNKNGTGGRGMQRKENTYSHTYVHVCTHMCPQARPDNTKQRPGWGSKGGGLRLPHIYGTSSSVTVLAPRGARLLCPEGSGRHNRHAAGRLSLFSSCPISTKKRLQLEGKGRWRCSRSHRGTGTSRSLGVAWPCGDPASSAPSLPAKQQAPRSRPRGEGGQLGPGSSPGCAAAIGTSGKFPGQCLPLCCYKERKR